MKNSKIKTIKFLLLIVLLGLTNTLSGEEYFDPFSTIKNTPQGKQLLDLAKNAEFDVDLAQQQLKALSLTGVGELGLEFRVAEILAYVSVYHQLSDFDKISEQLKALHLLGIKKNHDWILAKYFLEQAQLSLKQGHFLKGFEDSNKSIILAEELDYQNVVAKAKYFRGIFNSKMGHSSNALKDYLDSESYFNKTNDINNLAAVYISLVVLYIDRKEYEKALRASDNAIAVQNKMPRISAQFVATNYINRAIVLGQLGMEEKELEAFISAQENAIQSNDISLLSSVYANLSDYFLRHKNYTLAIERAERCLGTASKIKDNYTTAICLINRGLARTYNGNKKSGFNDLNQALELIENENMEATLIDVYQSYFEAYQYVDDYKSANVWLQKKYEIMLSHAKNDKENYFHEVEENFKKTVEDREQIHTSFKVDMMDNILNQESLVKKLWIAIIVLFIALLFAVIIILRLKSILEPKYYG